jgi:competence protein ComEC
VWLQRDGQARGERFPAAGYSADHRLACDSTGCIYRAAGQVVALIHAGDALSEDCRGADIVISAVPVRGQCPHPHTVIDRFDLWRDGAHAVYLAPEGARVVSVAAVRGRRPWTNAR